MRESSRGSRRTRAAVLAVVPLFVVASGAAPAVSSAPVAATALRGQVLFSLQDPEIVESSGLVFTAQGRLVTTNDSGDTGRVFSLNPADGSTMAVTRWSSAPVDVEALARGRGRLVWVGDIGDNREVRSTIEVASVLVGASSATVQPIVYRFAYPDGPHNAETLMADPATNRIYIATKSADGGRLYRAPVTLARNRVNQLTPVGQVLPTATDGSFFPDGQHVVVRNYGEAAVYDFPSMQLVSTFDLPAEPQGEGIAVDGKNRLLLSSEGAHTDVLRVTLPAGALADR